MKISFVILTKNEERNIERCLASIKPFADEILILDEFSSDETVNIAKKFDAKILQNKNSEDFARARNLAMKSAENEWVFFVDADEILEGGLGGMDGLGHDYYRLKRTDVMWGREIKHGENGSWNEIRLVKKNAGMWRANVHEVFDAEGAVGQLEAVKLMHYPHQTVSEFLEEINHYSDLRANELLKKGEKTNIWQIVFFPLGKFLTDYILLLGFLDGVQGFIIAAMMSLHSFLVRGKLYVATHKSR